MEKLTFIKSYLKTLACRNEVSCLDRANFKIVVDLSLLRLRLMSIRAFNGARILLTDEKWKHIVLRHPELEDKLLRAHRYFHRM